jgi:hypothetical protein
MAQSAPINLVERDFAAIELDELAVAHEGRPWLAWKQAVLDWHLRTLAAARAEAWIPGLAESRDPIVQKALDRYWGHHMAAVIKRLKTENLDLRRKMLDLSTGASGGRGPAARDLRYKL